MSSIHNSIHGSNYKSLDDPFYTVIEQLNKYLDNYNYEKDNEIQKIFKTLNILINKTDSKNEIKNRQNEFNKIQNKYYRITQLHLSKSKSRAKEEISEIPKIHDDTAIIIKEEQLKQEEQTKQQDLILDDILILTTNLKNNADNIHAELDSQNKLLDDINNDVDNTQSKLNNVNFNLKKLIKFSNNNKCYCIALFLILILVVILVILIQQLSQ
jgi:hypothetical protein